VLGVDAGEVVQIVGAARTASAQKVFWGLPTGAVIKRFVLQPVAHQTIAVDEQGAVAKIPLIFVIVCSL
jgi:hypothetical protein